MFARSRALTDKYNLIKPLKELVTDGSSDDDLTPEHQHVLDNANSMHE